MGFQISSLKALSIKYQTQSHNQLSQSPNRHKSDKITQNTHFYRIDTTFILKNQIVQENQIDFFSTHENKSLSKV